MGCMGCFFWKNNLDYEPLGNCRRYPPVHSDVIMRIGMKKAEDSYEEAASVAMDGWLFPMTAPDDWCGEFKPLKSAVT